jgi:tetratricopeptide (TPR) repeat protein
MIRFSILFFFSLGLLRADDDPSVKGGEDALSRGDNYFAIKCFSEALARNANNAKAFALRGAAFDRIGDHLKAIDDFTQAVLLDSVNPSVYLGRGLAYNSAGNFNLAVQDLGHAIELDPKNVLAYRARADAWDGQGDYGMAVEDEKEALSLAPDDPNVWNDYAWILATCPDGNYRDGAKAVELALKCCQSGVKDQGFLETLAAACAEMGDYENAIKSENQYLLVPNLTAQQKSDGEARLALYNAHHPYHLSLISAPQEQPANPILKAEEAYRNGDFAQAIKYYTDALGKNPNDINCYICRGDAYNCLGDFDLGMADETKALALGSKDPTAYLNRGAAYGAKGDFDRAIADELAAIKLNPKMGPAYSDLGHAYVEKGDFVRALDAENQAITLDNNDSVSFGIRAIIFKSQGAYDKALADFNEAIRLNPRNVESYNGLAWFLATCPNPAYRNGKKALEIAKQCCEDTTYNNPTFINTLAAACAETGDFVNATIWESQYLHAPFLNPRQVAAAKKRLALYQAQQPYHETAGPQ